MQESITLEDYKIISDALVSHALDFLAKNLPRSLSYHSVGHVMEVIAEVRYFAELAQLAPHKCHLLSIAAAFHDFGYLYSKNDNEEFAAAHVESVMKSHPFSSSDIDCVKLAILSTKADKSGGDASWIALNDEARYLIDADLSNFGRRDFFSKLELLAEEQAVSDRLTFLKNSLSLLKNHQWKTDVALKHRQSIKDENIAKLQEMIYLY